MDNGIWFIFYLLCHFVTWLWIALNIELLPKIALCRFQHYAETPTNKSHVWSKLVEFWMESTECRSIFIQLIWFFYKMRLCNKIFTLSKWMVFEMTQNGFWAFSIYFWTVFFCQICNCQMLNIICWKRQLNWKRFIPNVSFICMYIVYQTKDKQK